MHGRERKMPETFPLGKQLKNLVRTGLKPAEKSDYSKHFICGNVVCMVEEEQ